MEFSEADYQRAVDAVKQALREVESQLDAVNAAVAQATNGVVIPVVHDALVWAGNELVACGRAVIDFVIEVLQGAAAPVFMGMDALTWSDIKGGATDVQGVLRVDQLPVRDHWKGAASDRYALAVASQSGAAGRVASLAESTALTLAAAAAAGTVFYIAVAAVLWEFFSVLVASCAAILSGEFSWAGLAASLAEAEIAPKALTLAKTALVTFLGTQVAAMVSLRNQAGDNSVFTDGHWPRAVTEAYSDATVTDGDAEWSYSR